MTTAEAAALLGVTPGRVRTLAGAGRLPGAVRVGSARRGEWEVPPEALEAYRAEVAGRAGKLGRPARVGPQRAESPASGPRRDGTAPEG